MRVDQTAALIWTRTLHLDTHPRGNAEGELSAKVIGIASAQQDDEEMGVSTGRCCQWISQMDVKMTTTLHRLSIG